jgi:hypothetical protein
LETICKDAIKTWERMSLSVCEYGPHSISLIVNHSLRRDKSSLDVAPLSIYLQRYQGQNNILPLVGMLFSNANDTHFTQTHGDGSHR